jgi:hypothetical protein
MDVVSNVLTLMVVWTVISVPSALIMGALIGAGSTEPQPVPVHVDVLQTLAAAA